MSLEETPLGKKGSLKQRELPKIKAMVMVCSGTQNLLTCFMQKVAQKRK